MRNSKINDVENSVDKSATNCVSTNKEYISSINYTKDNISSVNSPSNLL